MRFRVRRTSSWEDEKPCEGAVLETVAALDKRTAPAHKLPGGEALFLAKGHDHKLLKTTCSRLIDTDVWVFDGDILAFIEQHGQCIVSPPSGGWTRLVPPVWEVEIYDDYRE